MSSVAQGPLWTEAEREFLRRNAPSMTAPEIAIHLGKSVKAVGSACWRMGLKTRTSRAYPGKSQATFFEDGTVRLALSGKRGAGKTALIDAEKYELISQWLWNLNDWGYATRSTKTKSGHRYMHRLIISAPNGVQVDHINGDPLDNRLSNLRLCNANENARNRHSACGSSVFRGVAFHKATSKWVAVIGYESKNIHLGLFESEIEAAKAYDVASLKLHGEFASPNFP